MKPLAALFDLGMAVAAGWWVGDVCSDALLQQSATVRSFNKAISVHWLYGKQQQERQQQH